MNRRRLIVAALLTIAIALMMFGISDPERAARLAQAQRDAALSGNTKDIVLILMAVGIGAYLVWFLLVRRD